MSEKTGTIHIKWVRSGIGFSRRQKEVVKSIGLGHLNQVVVRPDTAQVRGLVAKVQHLVQVVDPPATPAWINIPEYKIVPAEFRPEKAKKGKKAAEGTPAEAPTATEGTKAAAAEPAPTPAATESKAEVAEKRSRATKRGKDGSPENSVSVAAGKPKPRKKAAERKPAAKKESKPKKGKV